MTPSKLPKEILMKRLFICATALGLFAAVPALSARDDNHGNKHDAATQDVSRGSGSAGGHQNNQGRAMTGGTHTNTGGTFQNMRSGPSMGTNRTTSYGAHQNAPTADTAARTRMRTGGTNAQSTMSGNHSWTGNNANAGNNSMHHNNTGQGNSGWTGNTAGRHSSINSLRLNVQASRQFHNGNYNAPQGYQYRHWGYGDRLPRLYFARDYWITDFMAFGLFEPPAGLIWVRYGNDALLIDEESGDIVQVDYGVFY
jgi:Ni/Co efflux regulator RcnB